MGRRDQVTRDASGAPKYQRTAILLHWLLAVLLIALIALGLYMTGLPRNTPARGGYFNLHKSLGLLAFALIALRGIRRLRFGAPAAPILMPPWQRRAAALNHAALYMCMVLMPVSGYLGSSFGKFGVKFFGLALPQWGWEDARLQKFFVETHHGIAGVFIALILVHTAAALYHLTRRDGVFGRMWPGRSL